MRKETIILLGSALLLAGCSMAPSSQSPQSKEPAAAVKERKPETADKEDKPETDPAKADSEPDQPVSEAEKAEKENSPAKPVPEEEKPAAEEAVTEGVSSKEEAAAPEETIRLNVPAYEQETSYWCGPASLQMVLAYYGIDVSQAKLAEQLHTDPVTGTEYADLAQVAQSYLKDKDLVWSEVILPAWSDDSQAMKEFEARCLQNLRQGNPTFVSINNHQIYPDLPDGVHQLVVYGADVQGDTITQYYFLNPSYIKSGRFAVTADELYTAMQQNAEPGYVW